MIKRIAILTVALVCAVAGAQVYLDQLNVDNVRIDANTISTTNTNGHLVIAPNGTGLLEYTPGTASRVLTLDSNKRLSSSSVTDTTLSYLDIGSSLTTLLAAKAPIASPTFTGTITGTLSGNASTATALAANPSDCAANQFATTIAASGNLTCAQPAFTDIAGVATIAQGGTNNGSLGVTAGGLTYTDGSKLMNTGAGTTGQIMTSNGASAPTWQAAPAGGTNDQREYVSNGKFEVDVTGWTTYDDAAAAPVDGTGGTVSATFLRTTTTAEILRDTASAELTKDAANRQGEGVCVAFTMDRQEAAGMKATPVSFEYQTTANYASGDVLVYAIDVTAATVQAVQTIQSTTAGTVMASSTPTRWNGVIHPTTTNTSYKLCLHIATTNASAWDMHVDSVHVGNQNVVPGAIGADLGTETWTDSWANTTTSVKLTRVLDRIYVDGTATLTGTPTNTSFDVTIPAAYTPAQTFSSYYIIDEGSTLRDDSAGTAFTGVLAVSGTNQISVYLDLVSGTNAQPAGLSTTTPFTWATADTIRFRGSWKVANWQASAALSTTETMLSTQVFAAYRNGALSINNNSSTTVSMDVVEIDNLNSLSSGKFVAKRTGKYLISGNVTFAASTFTSVQASISKNAATTVASGVNLPDTATSASQSVSIPPKVVSLVAGDTLELVGYQTNGGAAARSISTGAATTYLSVNELPDFSIFSVYGQTEYSESINSTAGTNWPFSAGFWGDLTSLTLQPGEYDMTAITETVNNGAVTTGNVAIGISTTSGNSSTGLSTGVNRAIITNVGTTTYQYTLVVPSYRVVVTSPTTYYLKGICVSAITNFQHTGYRLSARRVK